MRSPMRRPSRLAAFLSWLALPVYAWQGLGVRKRTSRLLPAAGSVTGIAGSGEPVISLLVLGDSSAASVGIALSENGLCARLAALIAARTGCTVRWRAAGFNSATSGQILDHVVPNLAADPWTHIVLAIGTNDIKNFHSVRRFKKEFGGLLYALRAKWPDAHIVWQPVVAMIDVPALPKALAMILEARAGAINAMGTRLCLERSALPATRLAVTGGTAGFSSDGFHASEAGYRAWAEHLLPFVLGESQFPG
jgi:lysophospholipase L1-like esterase